MCSIDGQLGLFISEVGNIGNYLTISGVLDLEGLTHGITYPSTVDIGLFLDQWETIHQI